MIAKDYVRTMARYNRWQNQELFGAASKLSDADRKLDRGGFWNSIQATLSHLYWGDQMWLSRFGLIQPPDVPLKQSGLYVQNWEDLCGRRVVLDNTLVNWSDEMESGQINAKLKWYSGAMGRDTEAAISVLLPHIFNHQTHHRGQAHAMVTAAGGTTSDTDLFIMPAELWPE